MFSDAKLNNVKYDILNINDGKKEREWQIYERTGKNPRKPMIRK